MNDIHRRCFLLSAVDALVGVCATNVFANDHRRREQRRLLFNWDGSMVHCFGRGALGNAKGPLTREQFVSLVFTPLDENAVDAVLFSFGSGNVAEYQSKVLEWPGEADRFEFPAARTWHGGIEFDPADQYKNPKALADAGANPPAVIVKECHRRGMQAFVSLRMNDCHDGQHPRGTLPNPELATFKRQNPEWLVPDLDWWTALNFAHPRVRAMKLRVVEEFFDRWDFDGIELDWLRHTLYFPRGTERKNAHHLTRFIRDVRASLNERARRRGRSIEILVRVPERIEWCRDGGFDIAAWIEEDLVDGLILGQGLTTLPTLPEFRRLMKKRPLPIYPCLATYGNGYRISPEEVIRGGASNLWRDGANGLYAFNWFLQGDWRRKLLREIADPTRLVGRDKTYTLLQKVEAAKGEPGADYVRYNAQSRAASLPFSLRVNDGPKTISLPVAAEVGSPNDRPKRAELWLAVDHLGKYDQLRVALNGRDLALNDAVRLEAIGHRMEIPPGNGMLGLPSEQAGDAMFEGLRIPMPVEVLVSGANTFTISLRGRTSGMEHDLRVTRVELATRY